VSSAAADSPPSAGISPAPASSPVPCFLLREADNVGSGRERAGGGLAEIRARVAAQLAAGVVLGLADLAIDGDVLMDELDLPPSPRLGRLLDVLLERAVADPSLNDRTRLLALARSLIQQDIV
jgi:hypothetical protein